MTLGMSGSSYSSSSTSSPLFKQFSRSWSAFFSCKIFFCILLLLAKLFHLHSICPRGRCILLYAVLDTRMHFGLLPCWCSYFSLPLPCSDFSMGTVFEAVRAAILIAFSTVVSPVAGFAVDWPTCQCPITSLIWSAICWKSEKSAWSEYLQCLV